MTKYKATLYYSGYIVHEIDAENQGEAEMAALELQGKEPDINELASNLQSLDLSVETL